MPFAGRTSDLILAGVLGQCWYGVAVPGEVGHFSRASVGSNLKWLSQRAVWVTPVLLNTLQGPEETGEERQTEGWGYPTHAVCTSSPDNATVLAKCFSFK